MESARIALVLKKIQTRGVSWFFSRLLQETERGTAWISILFNPLMTVIYWTILYPIHKIRLLTLPKKDHCKDTLFLFYDFEVSPITFDFAWALTLAEHERKKCDLNKLQVIFVPGKTNSLRVETPDYEEKIDLHSRYWRRNEILYAMCQLLPTCVGITFCSTREEASLLWEKARPNIFPNRYTTLFPIAHCTSHALTEHSETIMPLRATDQAKRYIQQWLANRLKNRKLITITLRNSTYMSARNSNISAWTSFAKKLNPDEFFVVFVPDTDDSLNEIPEELSEFIFFSEPSWNLNLRAALYETSYLNLGVNNGAMVLCWLNAKCRYITFKLIVSEAPQATETTLVALGFKIGKSLPFASALQKWVWEKDNIDVIEHAFNSMCQLISKQTRKEDLN